MSENQVKITYKPLWKLYDVILANPPFGARPQGSKEFAQKNKW